MDAVGKCDVDSVESAVESAVSISDEEPVEEIMDVIGVATRSAKDITWELIRAIIIAAIAIVIGYGSGYFTFHSTGVLEEYALRSKHVVDSENHNGTLAASH